MLANVFTALNIALLVYYSWKMALIALGLIAVGIIFGGVCLTLQVKYQRPLYDLMGKIQGLTVQFINGIAKLRVGGAESRAFYIWADAFARQKEFSLRSRMVTNVVVVFGTVLPLAGTISIFLWMYHISHASDPSAISTGDFLAFNSAFGSVLAGVSSTLMFVFPLLMVVPIFERTRPILESVPEVGEAKADPGTLSGRIEMSHVGFRYTADGPRVLKEVSVKTRPGEFAALVEPSGSGKSTIYRLLMGFETPESGSIYYDGQDLESLDIQAVRRQIGVVLQNGRLVGGSIFDNIVGASRLTLDDAWEAARMCALEDDIKAMPMGMQTIISEEGSNLSGGQRQWILIARAIVRRPRIILFDEATSALDNESQAVVCQSLESLQATRIVIAHRLSTIRKADCIHVVVAGEIVESGNYEALMAQDGVFADLARRQLA